MKILNWLVCWRLASITPSHPPIELLWHADFDRHYHARSAPRCRRGPTAAARAASQTSGINRLGDLACIENRAVMNQFPTELGRINSSQTKDLCNHEI